MAQDFWASSGFSRLVATPQGLAPTDAWIARFLERDELRPPADAGPREQAMFARLAANPRAAVAAEALEAVVDPDARENWAEFLRFRDRLARARVAEVIQILHVLHLGRDLLDEGPLHVLFRQHVLD